MDYSARSGGIIGIIFSIFFNMKVYCVFSLESPHRCDSNEYTQHAIINIKKKITLNYPKYNNGCSYGIFSLGTKNEFETAVVNEPSMFEPLKFFCTVQLTRARGYKLERFCLTSSLISDCNCNITSGAGIYFRPIICLQFK